MGALDVAADAAGNSYLTGEFSGMAKFGTSLLTSAGASDVFLAKYSTLGDLVWLRQGGGTSDDESFSVVVDSNANAYVAGVFSGTATIGGTTLTSAGDYDIFVAKFDTAGSPLWVVRGGGSSRDAALDIAVDPSCGHVLAKGYPVTVSTRSSYRVESINV